MGGRPYTHSHGRSTTSMDRHTVCVIRRIRIQLTRPTDQNRRPSILLRRARLQHHPQRHQLQDHAPRPASLHQTAPTGQATRRLHQSGRQRQRAIPASSPPLGVREERTLRSSPSVASSEGDSSETPRCASFSGQQHPGCTITLAQHRPPCLPSEASKQPNTSCYIFGAARRLPLWFRLRTRITYLLRRPPSITSEGAGPCTGRHYAY